MKNRRFLVKFIFSVFIFNTAVNFSIPVLHAELPIVRIKKGETEDREASLAESLGNSIAIGTGQVRDGEQVPLPSYQDGKKATRKEAQYIVSPAEVPTSMTYNTGQITFSGGTTTGSSGTYYIKCKVDQEGVVSISLWQQSGTGEGTEVVSSDSYQILKENYDRAGITNAEGEEGADNVVTAQMKSLSQRLVANYMVIAIRSSKNKA